ncbi:MAG: glycosyltransferase family 4 protein [bacterium]|nr:glycosyltransferase family 4 protein [bacterium]
MQKIKVLHIITRLELGGAQKNTIYTFKNIGNKFESYLIAGEGDLLFKEVKEDKNFFVAKNLIREIRPFKDILALIELIILIYKIKPDVVHTHSSKAGILGRIAAWMCGVKKIIHTYHGFGFNIKQKALTRNFFILLEKLIARITHILIYVSYDNMHTAEKIGIKPLNKSIVIRSGIKVNEFKGLRKNKLMAEKFGINSDKFIITSVGPFKPQKNFEDLVKVAKILINQSEAFHFIIVGDGKLKNKIVKIIEMNKMSKNFTLTGWIEDIKEIYEFTDLFVLTSLWEGLPRALVEALAAGIPAICYDTDGINDILIDFKNGFKIKKMDIETFASRCLLLYYDKILHSKLCEGARNSVNDEFDIDLMVKRLEDVYIN